jgi:hypothetical protein
MVETMAVDNPIRLYRQRMIAAIEAGLASGKDVTALGNYDTRPIALTDRVLSVDSCL